MVRMRKAGYSQSYRKNILSYAFSIYDKMKVEDESGKRPMYRLSNWNIEERMKEKARKQKSWSNKGGYIAPIFIHVTPNGELAKLLEKVVDDECAES